MMILNHIPVFGPNGCIICEQERKMKMLKTNKNQFQSKTLKFAELKVITEHDGVIFRMNNIYEHLNDLQVNELRNLLSEWKNDKRYRDQRREARSLPNVIDKG